MEYRFGAELFPNAKNAKFPKTNMHDGGAESLDQEEVRERSVEAQEGDVQRPDLMLWAKCLQLGCVHLAQQLRLVTKLRRLSLPINGSWIGHDPAVDGLVPEQGRRGAGLDDTDALEYDPQKSMNGRQENTEKHHTRSCW